MTCPLLQIRDLRTCFHTARGIVKALDGIDLSISAGDTLGVVGESGCGKTVLALSVMGLIPSPPGRITSGTIFYDGRDILKLNKQEFNALRGAEISMIFQEPMTSLNPVFTIGDQVAEVLNVHQGLARREAADRAIEMLRLVGVPLPERRRKDYPHQLSGGMRQRVMIAMALACRPKLMLADEPTTALDVTIQAQILNLIEQLKREMGTSVVMITHDLGVIAETADQVAVMYAGKIVEYAPASDLFLRPLHPYTRGLMESIPRIDSGDRHTKLKAISGVVPNLYDLPRGCAFQERCPEVFPECRKEAPLLSERSDGHLVRCIKFS